MIFKQPVFRGEFKDSLFQQSLRIFFFPMIERKNFMGFVLMRRKTISRNFPLTEK